MSRILIVDWLGRGGIAQVTVAWVVELGALGHQVTVVTREGRELGQELATPVIGARAPIHPILAHRAVAMAAAKAIRRIRPDIVMIQNYVLPALEGSVYRAAHDVGARLLVSIHDHRLHTRLAGTHLGLARHLRAADGLIAHSERVADALRVAVGYPPVTVLPLPLPVGMLRGAAERGPATAEPPFTAIHFGIVKRDYKGTDVVLELASRGVPDWTFTICGAGAPTAPNVRSINGYLNSALLRAEIQQSRACLVPYRWATQSAVVLLAQALGSVPIATRVGALAEQIIDGENGLLLPVDAPLEQWRSTLAGLSDPATAARMSAAAMMHARRLHGRFVDGARDLMGSPAATT